ncbi:uncharacterized protein LOC135812638 [Sycon ciliatum]|uniref:uncharacterized protein LOC135812638 n=1 Tax=Sycon ciliatum TaxID=27933 RepID=UPI0031F6142B
MFTFWLVPTYLFLFISTVVLLTSSCNVAMSQIPDPSCLKPTSVAMSPVAYASPSRGGVSPSISVRRSFDLCMDLAILRQLRSHECPFRRGSPAMDIVAAELSNSDPTKFCGINKKGVRDRVLLLLKLFNKGDEWKKRQSGTEEELTEKGQLLAELQELYAEKAQPKPAGDGEKQAALQARKDACVTLASKSKEAADEPAAKRKKHGTSSVELAIAYLKTSQEADAAVKKAQLELEQQQHQDKLLLDKAKMDLEERKFIADDIQRKKKQEMDEKDQAARLKREDEREEDAAAERRALIDLMKTFASKFS